MEDGETGVDGGDDGIDAAAARRFAFAVPASCAFGAATGRAVDFAWAPDHPAKVVVAVLFAALGAGAMHLSRRLLGRPAGLPWPMRLVLAGEFLLVAAGGMDVSGRIGTSEGWTTIAAMACGGTAMISGGWMILEELTPGRGAGEPYEE